MKIAALLVAVVVSFSCLAQSAGPAGAFEVASVRLTSPDSPKSSEPPFQTLHGTLATRGLSLRNCIVLAYQVQPAQIVGPNWIDNVQLDIAGKAATAVDDQYLYLMLRTLLAERLGLKLHVEQKEIAVYALTLAKGGTKFVESTTEGPLAATEGPGGITIQRISLFELATQLSGKFFDRPLINATGLKVRAEN